MIETTPTTSSPSKPKIRHAGGTRYDVQSRTRPERTHHTDVYHLTCDCEAGSRGKRCWALALAISFDAWRRQEGKKARVAAQHAHAPSAPAPAPAPVTTSAPVASVPAPVPATLPVAGDFHQSAGYVALMAAFE